MLASLFILTLTWLAEGMIVRSALDGTVNSEYLFLPANYAKSDVETAIAFFRKKIIRRLISIKRRLSSRNGLKFTIGIKIFLRKYADENRKYITNEVWFRSSTRPVYMMKEITREVKSAFNEITSHYDSYVHVGSGWSLRKIICLQLNHYSFGIVRGGCQLGSLPGDLRGKHGVLSLKGCPKNKCFVFAVAAALTKVKRNPTRTCDKVYLGFMSILPQMFHFPVKLSDVRKFEKLCEIISVNVYGFEKVAFPLYISGKKCKHHVNLLLYKEHYYPIRNLSALIKQNKLAGRRKLHVCQFCLAYFSNKTSYGLHGKICGQNKSLRLEFPAEGEAEMSFTSFSNTIPAPFAIYCDLETLVCEEEAVNEGKLLTLRKHVPISAGALRVCRSNKEFSSRRAFFYTGKDCVVQLLYHLQRELSEITSILDGVNFPIKMTSRDKAKYNSTLYCTMCKSKFGSPGTTSKVRDHDHLSGEFRSALCNRCNLTYGKTQYKVNIFFHGLGNYDSHFIVQELHRYQNSHIRVIPKSGEKYLALTIDSANFKDSYCFLGSSLAVLVQNLVTKGKSFFTNVHQYVKNPQQREMCFQKGIYPYSYMDSIEKLREKKLPPIEAFKNDLTGQDLSEADYHFAKKAWEVFECKTMRDYMECYLLCDIYLLADVFENYRTKSMGDYGLDPVYYFSTPHFTLDAFLKQSNAVLDLIIDPNQYLFLKKGIRGGLSMVSKRYSKANHPALKEGYDPTKPHKHILYLDANNLYGKAMMSPLPFGDFEWMNESELTSEFITGLESDGALGCIVECDFQYPQSVHDSHSDYPLAPYKLRVPFSQLSPTARDICEKHNLKSSTRTEKLMTTLLPRTGYVLHHECFKLYTSLGLVVTKIHRGVKFQQREIIREYIEFNSEKRAESTNNFDSDFYKLMSNSLFGKTIERPENRMRVVLTSNPKKHQNLVGSPCYKESKIINSDLVAATLGYPAVKVKKPFYIGMAILEIAKVHMYKFHYQVMKAHFGENLHLLYTDTDSLLYEISNVGDLNCELGKLSEHFDFSNYPQNHPLYSQTVKKTPGYFKDEVGGKHITEFVGLRSKMYSFTLAEDSGKMKETKTAKGVKKSVIERDLHHSDYRQCLFEQKQYENSFTQIRSKSHNVATSKQRKITLSSFDDKRYLLNCSQSLPYGHYSLNPEN